MSTESDIVLVVVTLKNAPMTPSEPFTAQTVGFTSGDSDSGSSPVFRHGWIDAESPFEWSSSLDVSQGKGGYAESISGSMTLIDDGISAAIDAGKYDLMGATVRAYSAPYVASAALVELVVVDVEVDGGSVRLVLNSPDYIQNKALIGSRTITQLSTDPVDSSNPTDPTYLESKTATQVAGMAFGGVPVSLKIGDPIPAIKLIRYAETDLYQGGIASGSVNANTPSTTADQYDAPNPTAYVHFWCKDAGEATRFYNEIQTIIAAGYRIIISDGTWFVDTSSLTNGASAGYPFSVQTVGTSPTHHSIRVAIQEYDTGVNQVPPDGIEAKQISLFAVSNSVSISAMQSVLDGFARNQKTTPISGEISFQDGITAFTPALSDDANFIAIIAVPNAGITFMQNSGLGWVGGVDASELSGGAGYGSGSSKDIVMDASVGWNGGTTPATFGGAEVGPGDINLDFSPIIRMRMRTALQTVDADFVFSDGTYTVSVQAPSFSAGMGNGNARFKISAPFAPADLETFDHVFTALNEIWTHSRKANRNPSFPLWITKFNNLSDLTELTPSIKAMHGDDGTVGLHNIHDMHMSLFEVFVWAVRKFSFSSIYATIFPFWTRGSCLALATRGSNILAGGQGIGSVANDGSVSWRPFVLPQNIAGVLTGYKSVYNTVAPEWITIGWITPSGESSQYTLWYTTGAIWNQGLSAIPTEQFFDIAVGGGKVVIVGFENSGAHSGFRVGTTAASLGSFTNFPTGMSQARAAVYDGVGWWIFGTAGQSLYTTNWTSFTSIATAVSFQALAAEYVNISGFSGLIITGDNGKYAFATLANAALGNWYEGSIPGGGYITSVKAGQSCVCCTSSEGVWAVSDFSHASLTWRRVVEKSQLNTAYKTTVAVANVGSSEIWAVSTSMADPESPQVITSSQANQADLSTIPEWIPWGTQRPEQALQHIRARFLGGMGSNRNPVRWTDSPLAAGAFGIAFDPPSGSTADKSGTPAADAFSKIAQEWWMFAGAMASDPNTIIDGTADNIQVDLPELNRGNVQDVATLLTVQYRPFGGEYLGKAYIQNIEAEYSSGNDAFYFAGWDAEGSNTNGLAIWTACRNAYLKTGILRSASLTFDSVQDAATMGALMTATHPDLGRRIDHICGQTRYFKCEVDGNDSAAALAMPGNRYKPNPFIFSGRGLVFGNATSAGIVVEANHNATDAKHAITIALPPI